MNKTNWQDLVLAVTYKCNSRCQMCSIWQRTDQLEMPVEYLNNLPKNLQNLNITGGEPFLHSNFVKLIETAKRRCPGVDIIISTNGFATELILEKMKAVLSIDVNIGVAISIDGRGEKHNQVRGIPGGYDKVLATIHGLKALGVKHLKIAFTLGDYNIDELLPVYGLSKELGVEFTLAVVHSSDNFFGQDNKINQQLEMIKVLDILIKKELSHFSLKRWGRAYFANGIKYFLQTGNRILPDYTGIDSAFVDPTGIIFSSDVSSEKIGQLSAENLEIKNDIILCPANWMICTARPAMKRHKFKVLFWVIKNKFFV